MLSEPVRGACPDSSFFSLPGIDQLRAYMRHYLPSTPLSRLLGGLATQVSSGTAVLLQPISPWFDVNDGYIELTPIAEYAVNMTALTGAPAGVYVRPVDLSIRYLRPCTVDNETLVARGRILHAGASFTTVDVLIEDSLGRAVAHASGSVVFVPMDPPPPPLSGPLQVVEEPIYSTPDPPQRALPPRDAANLAGGDVATLPPLAELFGVGLVDVGGDRARVELASSEWFARLYPEVAPGILGGAANLAVATAIASCKEASERLVIISDSKSFIAPVPTDGRRLVATGRVRHRRDEVLVVESEVTDDDGRPVMFGYGTCMLRPRDGGPPRRLVDRMLLTVLFTDLVGSTERAGRLGDARWTELLSEHQAVVRRKLAQHKGREVKTTGDGFLCTFDSPTRAVQCARAIREGVRRLGLQVRVGIHTGECEISGGDVAGLAVHAAARVESAAAPDEILISHTVRDLIAGSGVALAERGERNLKGLEGSWALFAVAE